MRYDCETAVTMSLNVTLGILRDGAENGRVGLSYRPDIHAKRSL